VIKELRNILFFLGIAVSLLFATFHTYAFRADESIDWWFFGLFAFIGAGIVVVIAQMERNALLSRLSNGTPGQLGTNFYLQLLKYGTVPFSRSLARKCHRFQISYSNGSAGSASASLVRRGNRVSS